MLYPLSHLSSTPVVEWRSLPAIAELAPFRRCRSRARLRHRMGPREDVQVRHDHPDLEEVGLLFARHLAQEPAEEAR